MQEKRKRAAHEIHADSCATHTTNSSISTGNGCACTSAEQKKRHSAPDWGPPRPQDDRHHANATAVHPVELLSASEETVRRQAAAKGKDWNQCVRDYYHSTTPLFQVHREARFARESLQTFSRVANVDATRAVERRLQKLWSGPSEVMASNRPVTTSESLPSRSTVRTNHSRAWTHEAKLSQLKKWDAGIGHSPKPDVQDWRVAVPRLARFVSNGSAGGGGVAVHVLADRSLWTTITEFMTGLPFAVLQFEKAAAPKYSIRSEVAYKSKIFFALDDIDEVFPKSVGLLPQLAIAEDNRKILQLLFKLQRSSHYRAHSKLDFGRVLRCAIWFKRWKILRWLVRVLPHDCEWKWEPDLMNYAVFQGNFALMNWLFARCPDESTTLTARHVEIRAAGDLEMVKWLHDHGYSFSVWMMNAAAAKGSMSVVRFLHRHRSEGCTTDAMDLAARYGHLEVVKFLHTHRTEGCTSKALDGAAQNGNLEIVKFFLKNREEGCIASAIAAAEGNHKHEVVEDLQNIRWDSLVEMAQ